MAFPNILYGVLIGEHSFKADSMIDEINERIISKGYNFTSINTSYAKPFPSTEQLVSWAKYLHDNKIYFHFVRTAQSAPEGKPSQLEPEAVKAICDAAGEYFLGDAIAEPGHAYAAKEKGYYYFEGSNFKPNTNKVPKTDAKDMEEAHRNYVELVKRFADQNKSVGMPASISIEATALSKYNAEAGITLHLMELPNGDPDLIIPSVRGAVKSCNENDFWGTLIAHEWYAGMRHDDPLKMKRLQLIAKHIYIHGGGSIMLESGDECVSGYGHYYTAESPICKNYVTSMNLVHDIIKNDVRPARSPKVTFGVISGLHDGWTGFCQSSVWSQWEREEWGHNDSEYSYRLLEALGTKRKWSDLHNFGNEDTSALPAYGTFDIVPIEADVDALSKYEYLVFLGWNTMTDENMDKLTEYVRRGGRLLLSGAHLNYSVKRRGEFIPPSNEKLEALCGARFTGKFTKTNCGSKFDYESLNEKHLYPGTKDFLCDPLFASGYNEYMELELTTARTLAIASDAFRCKNEMTKTVIENKIGKGTVTFVTSKDYPGNPALTPLYNAIFREFVSSSARECDIKVVAGEKLRYTVYEGNKIYLLNTDYDLPITVKIIYNNKEQLVTLDALEMKTIQL